MDYHLEESLLVLEQWSYDLWHLLMENRGTHSERRQVLHDVLRGLAYLHSKGIVHADVKSSNIVVKVVPREEEVDVGPGRITDGIASLGTSNESRMASSNRNQSNTDSDRNYKPSTTSSYRVKAALIDLGLSGPSGYASVHLTTSIYRESEVANSWHHDVYSAGLVGLEMFAGISWTSTPSYTSALSMVQRVPSLALRLVLKGMLAENRNERLSAAEVLSVLTYEVIEPPSYVSTSNTRENEASSTILRVMELFNRGEIEGIDTYGSEVVEKVVISIVESLYYGKTEHLSSSHIGLMDLILGKYTHLFLPR